jgi:hypothetical protein
MIAPVLMQWVALATRAISQGIAERLQVPSGKDFNDDLKALGSASLVARGPPVTASSFPALCQRRAKPRRETSFLQKSGLAKRGVVAAASYEARVFGVRSAMPATTAMRQCPDLVFVPPRFDVYRAVSRQIHTIFAVYTAPRLARRSRLAIGPVHNACALRHIS